MSIAALWYPVLASMYAWAAHLARRAGAFLVFAVSWGLSIGGAPRSDERIPTSPKNVARRCFQHVLVRTCMWKTLDEHHKATRRAANWSDRSAVCGGLHGLVEQESSSLELFRIIYTSFIARRWCRPHQCAILF